MRRTLVLGNWKMNGSHTSAREWGLSARALCGGEADVGVLPPFVYLTDLATVAADSALIVGAQDVAAQKSGAFTGEIAAEMLADIRCTHVLIGHSERRHILGDEDSTVAKKFERALEAGLNPVLCVGETLEQREAGTTHSVVLAQLQPLLDQIGKRPMEQVVVAYEPVWAIGTGRSASPAQAQEVHALIRSAIAERDAMLSSLIRILYGGSVKGSNAAQLFALADIDGGLIGGASLVPDEFAEICRAASRCAIEKNVK